VTLYMAHITAHTPSTPRAARRAPRYTLHTPARPARTTHPATHISTHTDTLTRAPVRNAYASCVLSLSLSLHGTKIVPACRDPRRLCWAIRFHQYACNCSWCVLFLTRARAARKKPAQRDESIWLTTPVASTASCVEDQAQSLRNESQLPVHSAIPSFATPRQLTRLSCPARQPTCLPESVSHT